MADNNRLELDIVAVDDTGPATAKAKANFKSMEQSAGQSAAGMNKIFDAYGVTFQRSVDRSVTSSISAIQRLEQRAALAGKSMVEKLTLQKGFAIDRYGGGDEAVIQKIVGSYDKLILARKKYEAEQEKLNRAAGKEGASPFGNIRRLVLGGKDLLEGYTRGFLIELTDYAIGTQGTGGVLKGASASIASITGLSAGAVIGIGSIAAAIGVLEIGGLKAQESLGKLGTEVNNFSLRTGIPGTHYQAFEYAAKATGQDISIFEKATRGLGQLADDNSPAGNQARREAERLGVHFRDQFGDLKPTQDMLLELADGFNRLPAGVQRSAASMEIFKRLGIELVPVLSGLRENLQKSEGLGATFSDADLKLFEEFHRTMLDLGTEWERLKLHIEEPIAVIVSFVNKGLAVPFNLTKIPGELLKYVTQGEPESPESLAHDILKERLPDQRGANRSSADTVIAARQSQEGLKAELEEATKRLATIPVAKLGESTPDQVQDYYSALDAKKRLEETLKDRTAASQDQIAASKEGSQLLAQYAEIQESTRLREIKAEQDSRKELTSPQDFAEELALARNRVDREQAARILERSKRVDENGEERDLTGTQGFKNFIAKENQNYGQRLLNEYSKVLADRALLDDAYLKARNDAYFKSIDEVAKREKDAHRSLIAEIDKLDTESRTRYFERQKTDNERDKNLALSQLSLIDAQSIREKIRLEDQKLAIETAYTERSLQIQIQKIQSEESVKLGELQRLRNIAGQAGEADYQQAKGKVEYDANVDIDEARKSAAEKELIQAQDIANKKTELAIQEDRKIFDSLKQSANGLFDALFEKSKSFADVLKGLFKTAILTPIKDIFSSQVAGFFTELLTGQKVTFNEVGNGQGRFGKLGGLLGRAGLGTPRFGQPGDHISNLNLPNHLGDAQLVSGAVPVVIVNSDAQSVAVEASGGGVQGLARSLVALPQILGSSVSSGTKALSAAAGVAPVALKRLQESVGSAITYSNGAVDALSSGSDQFISDYLAGQLPSAPPYQASDTVGYDALDEQSGGGFFGRIGGFFGKIFGGGTPATAGLQGSFGGIPGFSLPGAPSFSGGGGLAAFFGKAPGTQGLPDVSGPVPGQTLPGAPPIGGAVGFQGSGAASMMAAVGAGLVLDGLKRKPGIASALETTGGAAAIGYKLGGVSGAFIGAGLGLAADGIKRGGALGTVEAAGGGALVGFKLGGPIGAVIGAAVGAGAALIKTFFFKSDRDHAKDLVKRIYGLKINDSTADSIVQIAKQKYGGAIDIAVRSQDVRDLLKLYAETIGDKKGQAQFVADKVHSASLIEARGRLQQQAVYDNGQAYAYSSPLSTYGSVNTSPLPTSARDAGSPSIGSLQLVVNGQSASDLLAGQVAGVATPGFIQGRVLSASQSSNGRIKQAGLVFSPSAISG